MLGLPAVGRLHCPSWLTSGRCGHLLQAVCATWPWKSINLHTGFLNCGGVCRWQKGQTALNGCGQCYEINNRNLEKLEQKISYQKYFILNPIKLETSNLRMQCVNTISSLNLLLSSDSLIAGIVRNIHTSSIRTSSISENGDDEEVVKADFKQTERSQNLGVLLTTKSHVCNICGKKFLTARGLKVHLCTHSQEMPYICDTCGKGFFTSTELDIHRIGHSKEERPYKCSYCGKGFKTASHLESHQRKHTGERPYSCSVCGETFPSYVQLKRHGYKHSGEKPHQCEKCGQRFLTAQELTYHQRVHTGERPFVCRQCGKAFKQHSHLYHHQRVHSSERPFVCDICGNKYKNKGTLDRHKNKVHSGDILEVEV